MTTIEYNYDNNEWKYCTDNTVLSNNILDLVPFNIIPTANTINRGTIRVSYLNIEVFGKNPSLFDLPVYLPTDPVTVATYFTDFPMKIVGR